MEYGRGKKGCFKGLLPVLGSLLVPFLSTLAQLACKQNLWGIGALFKCSQTLSVAAVSLQMLIQVCFYMFTLKPSYRTQGNVGTILAKYGERS